LIRAARLNTVPNSDSLGRGLKVNKEEMVAMLVALEQYLKHDHQAEWSEWERCVKLMGDTLAAIPGVRTERFVPEIANEVPHLRVRWDPNVAKITAAEASRQLREGELSIELVPAPYVEGSLEVASWMLQPGEAEIVAGRLSQILKCVAT
jgi:L-seryl-tRNA(Ser) seleniumtransferase